MMTYQRLLMQIQMEIRILSATYSLITRWLHYPSPPPSILDSVLFVSISRRGRGREQTCTIKIKLESPAMPLFHLHSKKKTLWRDTGLEPLI